MTIDLVPTTDLAPSHPKRIVTVNASSMTMGPAETDIEQTIAVFHASDGQVTIIGPVITHRGDGMAVIAGTLKRPAMPLVHFELVGDVHWPDNSIIIGALSRKSVPLGGRIRLPVWTAATGQWAIRVRKSWAPQPYYIRVPSGTSTIDLSAIPPLAT